MAAIVNAATLTVGAGATTNMLNAGATNPGPSHLIIRTTSTGVLVGGKDLDQSGNAFGFELVANKEYAFDLRPIFRENPTDSAEGTFYVKNTTGSSVSVSVIATPLAYSAKA